MIQELKKSVVGKKIIDNDDEFEKKMMGHINLYNYECIEKDKNEYEVDAILGKHIISHLQHFFNKSKRSKTQKNRKRSNHKKKTYRKYAE